MGLSYTKTDKEYNQVDTFVHPTIVRDDNVENYSISKWCLGQISNSLNFINLPERIKNYLNTLNYSMSWSETNNNSNWLQNDYEKRRLILNNKKNIFKMINSYKINRMKITLSALIIGIFSSSFSQANEIGIIGFVLGNA